MARRSRPWFRLNRGWFVTIRGKQHNLNVTDPNAEAEAFAAFKRLMITMQGGPENQADPTCAEAVSAFLITAVGRLAEPTVKGYRAYLGRFVARFGTVRVSKLTAALVEDDARSRPTWSDDTRRNYLQAVEVMTRHAGRPLRLEKPPRGSAGAGAVIPESTYHMAVGAARGDLRSLLVCLWNTGCRPSELRTLTVELVDWSACTATLTKHKTRRAGKAHRLIVFPEPAMEALRQQRDRHRTGFLFRQKTGKPYTCIGLTKAVWRLSRRIGRPLTAYGCRHTFATDALGDGIPDTHVAALLGHGSTRMVHAHYSHLSENARLLKDQAARVRGRKPPPAAAS
jgi:integrase